MSKNLRLRHIISFCLMMSLSSTVLADSIRAYFNHNHLSYYTDPYRNIQRRGDNLEAILIAAINSAEKSIYLAVQELRLPLVAKALAKRYKDGIDVRLVFENQYNKTIKEMAHNETQASDEEHARVRFSDQFALVDINRNGKISWQEMAQADAIYILRAAGVPIKDDTFDYSRGSGLMHHKFMVVDDKQVLVGSANYTMSGIHGDVLQRSTRGNANSLVVIESRRGANIFNEEFFYMWGGKDEEHLPRFGNAKPYRGVQEFYVGRNRISVQFSPTSLTKGWANSTNALIASALQSARSYVLMALFVFSDQNITNSLLQTVRRHKIELHGLVERKFAYRYYSEVLDMWGIEMLDPRCQIEPNNYPWRQERIRNVGVPSLQQGDLLHHKFAVIDGRRVIMGSQNWSDSANKINDENVLIIDSVQIAQQYQQEFNRLNNNSRLDPPQYLIEKINERHEHCRTHMSTL